MEQCSGSGIKPLGNLPGARNSGSGLTMFQVSPVIFKAGHWFFRMSRFRRERIIASPAHTFGYFPADT
jgi:hypothetical protein